MPGDVNFPVRAFKSVGGQPIVIDSVKGSRMLDIDGNEYIDYVGSWGPAIIGHADDKAGSGVATLGLPDSPGVPMGATAGTLAAPFNDIAAVESIFEANKGEIAALFLEPEVGNSGFIAPKPDFLNALCRITKENIALLVFDEVMTGLRLSYGGAQQYFGIIPDLTTLGKIIGGGLLVGSYGGRREIMEMVAPSGPMYQAEGP